MSTITDQFHGIFPAALTFFDAQERLDEEATASHWEWLIKQGVDGLVIAGTSGEFIALSDEERLRLFRLGRQVVTGRVPVIYGAGHYSTWHTQKLCEQAEAEGADAVIIILPYYQRPPKDAVIQHYRDVRKATTLPIMLYNNPANTACVDLSPRDIVLLVEEGVLQMVKSTYETVVPVHDLRYLLGNKMAIFYGSFLAAFEGLLAGAHGWISGILNVVPGHARELHRAVTVDRDLQRATRAWHAILPLVHLYTHRQLGAVPDLVIYRSILKRWGRNGGFSRRPFYPLSAEQEKELQEWMQRTGWEQPERLLEEIK